MNERTIQIDVIGKIEGTQFMKCKLYTNENIVIIMMNEFDYERLKEEGIFIRDGQKSRFSRGVEYNQYFHTKKINTQKQKRMIMDKKEKNFATYKEFAKMLREVANIYSKLGDEPLLKEGYEYNAIRDAVQYVTNKHDFGYFIQPWKDEFLRMPFDVTKRKKWADYVAECHATGKEIDYDNYDWDK